MVTADIYHAKDICFLYLFFTQITKVPVLKCDFFLFLPYIIGCCVLAFYCTMLEF